MANGQCKKSLLTPSGEVEFENFDKAKNAICTDDNEECCDSRIIIKESISSECNIENGYNCRHAHGGFQLEFVSISRVINHMTCYTLVCSHWQGVHFIYQLLLFLFHLFSLTCFLLLCFIISNKNLHRMN